MAITFSAVLVHLWGIRAPLLGTDAFRQTETALQARQLALHGFHLLAPRFPVFGPPWRAPFEFPAFEALAALLIRVGFGSDLSVRVTALACFAASGLLLFDLLRRVAGRVAAFAGLLAFLFSPYALVWGAAGLPDYFATACALAFLCAGLRWRDTGRAAHGLMATAALCLALAVKGDASLFYVVPFVLYRSPGEPTGLSSWLRVRSRPAHLAILGVPLIVALAWTRHADAIKRASPATRGLTTGNLRSWYLGTVSQRLDPARWATLSHHLNLIIGPSFWLAVLGVVVLLTRRGRAFWTGMVLAVVLPIAVFFNVFEHHYYYLIALSPALAALIGLTFDFFWQHRGPISRTGLVMTAALLWVLPLYWTTAWYWRTAFQTAGHSATLAAATVIDRTVPTRSRLVIEGYDWNPAILYYAHRDGFMLARSLTNPAVARLLHQDAFNYWYAVTPGARDNDLLRTWTWVTPTGPHLYRMTDNTPRDVADATVLATSATAAIDAARSRGQALQPSLQLRCDGALHPLPTGVPTTWVLLQGPAPPGRQILVAGAPAPLPAFPAIVVHPAAHDGVIFLGCRGGGVATITSYAAPLPRS